MGWEASAVLDGRGERNRGAAGGGDVGEMRCVQDVWSVGVSGTVSITNHHYHQQKKNHGSLSPWMASWSARVFFLWTLATPSTHRALCAPTSPSEEEREGKAGRALGSRAGEREASLGAEFLFLFYLD